MSVSSVDKDSNSVQEVSEKLIPSLNLVFRTSYNTCLLNFVDKLSLWSSFVPPALHNNWEVNYGFTDEDLIQLTKYKKARIKLGWSKAADLFNWSYNGFLDNDYKDIRECIRYFETRVNKDGKSLKEEVQLALVEVEKEEANIKAGILFQDVSTITTTALRLFGIEKSLEHEIPCYLLYSPDRGFQGGANGDAITVEIPLGDPDKRIEKVCGVIFHEYMHLLIRVKNVLPKLLGSDAEKFYNQKIPNLYDDDLASFFDEVITYIFSNIYFTKDDPQKMIEMYQRSIDEGKNSYGVKSISIWKATLALKPVMDDYFDGQLDEKEARSKIFQVSKDFINSFQ